MASVFLAWSDALDEDVVLKILTRNTEEAFEDGLLARFESEYRIIASMKSVRIVRIFDFGIEADFAFIAMEFFPAGDLKIRMRKPVAPAEALTYGIQIFEALSIVHAAGVLHRDLKPANVMLRKDDSVALIDFGISKRQAKSDSDTETGPGAVLGTPFYASPEQLSGESTDARSDLYSAGVILFELLTGDKPFVGDSAVAICHLHLLAPIPRLPSRLAMFQTVVDELMAKKPDDRIATAELAQASLRAVARELAVMTTDQVARMAPDSR